MSATSAAFPFAPTLTRNDNENHAPGPEANWQESTLVALVDPQRHLVGFHRIGIHPNRNEASLYSWTQVDGKIVSRAKCTGLAIPAGPLTGAALAGVTLQTPEPLRTCRIQVDRDGVRTDLLFESFTGPVQMNMEGLAGASIGAGHDHPRAGPWQHRERRHSHSFDGVGFLDHSWGPRDGGTILAHRWLMAVLHAENDIECLSDVGTQRTNDAGLHGLQMGSSPCCRCALRVVCRRRPSRAQWHPGHHHRQAGARSRSTAARRVNTARSPMARAISRADKPMIYEAQGRVWRGMVEWSAMRSIPPWHRQALGLTKDNEWLQWNGRQPLLPGELVLKDAAEIR